VAGDNDDGERGVFPGEMRLHVEPVHVRHVQIENDAIRQACLVDFKNSGLAANVSTLGPAERINRISALRTGSSSSTTAMIGQALVTTRENSQSRSPRY
jgi:hypothetical protein